MEGSELSQRLYGDEYSSETVRRMANGSLRTLKLIEAAQEDELSGMGLITEFDQQKAELQKEKQKFFDQRREYNKLLTIEGRFEHLCESLRGAVERLNESDMKLSQSDVKVSKIATSDSTDPFQTSGDIELSKYDNEAVLVFGDWHYGMTTENVFNKYNTAICRERVNNVVQRAKERINLHRCSKLSVVILGDLFHGAIHTSARVASEELVCDQIIQVSEILAQALYELKKSLPDLREMRIYTTYGNHARTVQNKNDSIHRDNLERLIPWWLKQRLKDVSDIVIEDEQENEFIFLSPAGYDLCASHGDLDSVQQAPRLLPTLFQKKFNRDIKYILLADKHHRESFEEMGVTSFLCGSLCGTDDYANGKRLFSTPSQLLLIFNSQCGVDAEYRIKCD